jgi:alpha-pyrone synthase
MVAVYLNDIATAVPDYDVHAKFVAYCPRLLPDLQSKRLFQRMAARAQIEHRYSFLKPDADAEKLDADGFYRHGQFPDTKARMDFFEEHAFGLARRAIDQLKLPDISHLIITSCTGFYAPGLDFQIVEHYKFSGSVERTLVGFMGCFAAFNGLKLARHIVRSQPTANVLMLNLELCTLHLKPSGTLEEMLSFLIFSDGCAASIISSQASGLELVGFNTALIPDSTQHITWRIGELGFDMNLSGQVPNLIAAALPTRLAAMLGDCTWGDIVHWAIHPGGRSVLDAVRDGAGLQESQLAASREVLRNFGNMSSATIMFVLQEIMHRTQQNGPGCAIAFGPGLTIESMRFNLCGAGHGA